MIAKVSGVQIAVSVLSLVPVIGLPAWYVFAPSLHPPKVNPGLTRLPWAGAVTAVPSVVWLAPAGVVPVAPLTSKVKVCVVALHTGCKVTFVVGV